MRTSHGSALVRRFYDLGFNIEATRGTAQFLKDNGIRTRSRAKISEGSEEILESLRQGHVTYVINTLGATSGPTPTALPSAAARWRTT